MTETASSQNIARAIISHGTSSDSIYRMVGRILKDRHSGAGTLVGIGCGTGDLRTFVLPLVGNYTGADIVRYDDFPDDASFVKIDLDSGQVPLAGACADIVVAAETIEHLENPRAFFRELKRLTKPGGLILVTTPNQPACSACCRW